MWAAVTCGDSVVIMQCPLCCAQSCRDVSSSDMQWQCIGNAMQKYSAERTLACTDMHDVSSSRAKSGLLTDSKGQSESAGSEDVHSYE
eukprot:scaffold33440_cov18-Tisochrysis_lutea.AAC.5